MKVRIAFVAAAILSVTLDANARQDSAETLRVDASLIPQQEWESDYVVTGTRLGGDVAPEGKAPTADPVIAGPAVFAHGRLVSQLMKRPQATYQPVPQYPAKLLSHGVSGEAVIALLVDRKGRVDAAKVVSASHRLFAESATVAVRQWRFDPGQEAEGTPAESIVVVRIRFELGTHSPTTDALVNLALKSGSPDAIARAISIQARHDFMLTNVDTCQVDASDGISDLEAFRLTRDFLVREAPGKDWDISIPLAEGGLWKVRFVLLPTPGPIGSLLVDKESGKISKVEVNGRPINGAEPGATDNPGDAQ